MRVEIAGRVVQLDFEDPGREEWARARYAGFLTSRRPDVRIAVSVREAVFPWPWSAPRVFPCRGGAMVLNREMSAHVELRGRGSAVLSARRFPVNSLLRSLVSFHLLGRGGLLLHAAGVRIEAGAWVFPGRSGAGKTTLARRFPSSRLLSDEVVAVRCAGGRAFACGTPFPGEMGRGGRPGWLPLHGIAFLGPKGIPSLRALRPVDALPRLLARTFGGWAMEREVRALWRIASRLVRVVPSAELRVGRDEPASEVARRIGGWTRPSSRGTRGSPPRAGAR